MRPYADAGTGAGRGRGGRDRRRGRGALGAGAVSRPGSLDGAPMRGGRRGHGYERRRARLCGSAGSGAVEREEERKEGRAHI